MTSAASSCINDSISNANTVFCLSVFPQTASTCATVGSGCWGEAGSTNKWTPLHQSWSWEGGRGGKGKLWEQAEQGYWWPLGGTGRGALGWFGYKTMEGQPAGALGSYKILQPAENEWLPGLCGRQSCSPCLCNDFWSHIGGCPTHSVQRAFHHRRQSKVSKLQRLGSIWIFTHLESEKLTQNEEENICIFISSNFLGKFNHHTKKMGKRGNFHSPVGQEEKKIIFLLIAAGANFQWSCLPAM